MIQMTIKRLDLGGPEWEIAGVRDEVVASQGNVTCGNQLGSMSRILRSRMFGHQGVNTGYSEVRKMHTCNIAHLATSLSSL